MVDFDAAFTVKDVSMGGARLLEVKAESNAVTVRLPKRRGADQFEHDQSLTLTFDDWRKVGAVIASLSDRI